MTDPKDMTIKFQVQGARTQHLWGSKYAAMFCTDKITEQQATELLNRQPDHVIEILYAGEKTGWNSLVRETVTGGRDGG